MSSHVLCAHPPRLFISHALFRNRAASARGSMG